MQALADPATLFFVFGMVAGLVRSNLEIPPPISRFLSLYLLMALGLKGGFALAQSGMTFEVVIGLGAALFLAILIPMAGYLVLRNWVSPLDAAAIAATYGSVSAVTYITAVQTLDNQGIPHGGHMAAAMALMESPAILLAVALATHARLQSPSRLEAASPALARPPLFAVMREALTDGAQLLLLGAMLIGILTGESGQAAMKPFSIDLFKGMLAFFLLDMGLQAARNMGQLKGQSAWLLIYAIAGPLVHSALALLLGSALDMAPGNVILLMVLAASASYIAVPAVLRHAIPEANPALYLGLSLGLTFPFNILIGIPLYVQMGNVWL